MNLRDALLKAGKIDDKQKKRADRDQKVQQHQQQKQEKKVEAAAPPEPPPLSPEEVAAEAAARRAEKLKALISQGVVEFSGRRRFFFVARNKEILFLQVSDVVGYQLEQGQAAIAEVTDSAEHVVVTLDAALKVQTLDRDAVRFFNASRT
jgi:uncharacterized protein YaiL (DUF2058 family)